MKTVLLVLVTIAALALEGVAGKPTIENKDWEPACGGSNIAVTRVAGKLVAVDAFVEHFSEGRQWQCHFNQGKIVSALYRHFVVTRKGVGDSGEFTTEAKEDRVEVFHFPDHRIERIDPALKKDLLEVLAIVSAKGARPYAKSEP